MSITTAAQPDDEYAERWRQWQVGNAKSSRRAAIQARVAFAVVLTAAIAWLVLQLLSSPVAP